jgi:hypothetical protein
MRQGKGRGSHERGMVPKGMTPQSHEKDKSKSTEVCFYGAACTRPNCAYKHEEGKGNHKSFQVEPCRLDLAGLCYATAETCKKRHLVGEDRVRLIHNMSRTPCRFGLECRTKNCLYRHPQVPLGESAHSYANEKCVDAVNSQQAASLSIRAPADKDAPTRRLSDSSSVSHYSVHGSAAGCAAVPIPPAQYQWPPLPFGYHMMPYYHHPSFFFGMSTPPVFYDANGYAIEQHQSSEYLQPPLFYAGGGVYPRSVSLPGCMGGEERVSATGSSDALTMGSAKHPRANSLNIEANEYNPDLLCGFVVDSDASDDEESSRNESST